MRLSEMSRVAWVGLAVTACAPPPVPATGVAAGVLEALPLPHGGVSRRVSSVDPLGKNQDARRLDPGQTLTIFERRGAGIVRHFWMTIAPRSHPLLHRQVILRMYWDGEASPSVEVPLGDFFGVGFGEQRDFVSLPLSETSGGYTSYWPMPFHESARWTLTNMSAVVADRVYYNIDYAEYPSLPADTRHFHAQWRHENPTTPGRDYTILEAHGAGHLAGVALFMQDRHERGLTFLEGNERLWIDGEAAPSIVGTGTEDYFSSGWYFDRGPYAAPYHGVVIKDDVGGRVSAYRWHLEDAVAFRRALTMTIEHGHANQKEGDYSSTAYFYQVEPHLPFPGLPTRPGDLLAFVAPPPMRVPGAIEAESLMLTAKVSAGEVKQLVLGRFEDAWSGGAILIYVPVAAGDQLELTLGDLRPGSYSLTGYFAKSDDCAVIEVLHRGRAVGQRHDLFQDAPDIVPTGPVELGAVQLEGGEERLVVRAVDKNRRSKGYTVGIDAVTLRPAARR